MLILHLTNKCNLKCSYCFATPTQTELTLNQWKMIIDKTKTDHLSLSGGEPLMVWNAITKPLIEYFKVIYENRHNKIELNTNATLLTKDIADFLKDNEVSIILSLNGDKTYVDGLQGAGVYDIIINGLKYL